jgi:hypothetical protein
MPKRKRIKVVYNKLGRANAWGLADTDGHMVQLDERLRGKKHLEILVHEVVHILLPDASEEEVERISINLTTVLWKEGYRRIDNSSDEPLQDGRH